MNECRDLSEATLLVDGFGYLTTLVRTDLSGHLEYTERDKIEKWFQMLKMRLTRFHNTWTAAESVLRAGSPPSFTTITTSDRIRHSMDAHRFEEVINR